MEKYLSNFFLYNYLNLRHLVFYFNDLHKQFKLKNKMKTLLLLVTVFVLANSNFLATKLLTEPTPSPEVEDAC
jgi:hypothetical protein